MNDPILSPERVEEMRKRAEAATPGEWAFTRDPAYLVSEDGVAPVLCADRHGVCGSHEDKIFIAHAREDLPALIASHEVLRKRVEELEAHPRMFICSACAEKQVEVALRTLWNKAKEIGGGGV